MKKIVLFLILTFIFVIVFAQYDSLWTKTYGGGSDDYCNSVIETSDYSYLLGGETQSYGAGSSDFWLVKTDINGDTLFTRTYGGGNNDNCNAVIETSDSSYLLGGRTYSYGAGAYDYWLVKTDINGDTLLTRTYGGGNNDNCNAVIETSDSSYLLAGTTFSYGAGGGDFWLVKTDANGDTLWTKTYGGGNQDVCNSIIETSDSGYLLAGRTSSYGAGDNDYWLVKTDINGDTLWTKTYGGAFNEVCHSVIETSDAGYLLGGYTESYGAGNSDYWLVKTDINGDTLWTKTYGGAGYDDCYSVIETSDSSYLMTGYTDSYGPSNSANWVIKTDMNGDTLWTDTYGGAGWDYGYSAIETSDSSYLLGGSLESDGAGDYDFWIVKIANMVPTQFSIIPKNGYISLDSILFNWHPSYSNGPFSYELSINNVLDTVPQSDTTCTLNSLSEGQHIWYVTAVSDFGYRTASDNQDTFWIDRTPPAVIAVEEIEDTSYSGPYELRVMAEDTLSGIDSAAINYMLPGETEWSRVLITEQTDLWYTGYIPEATQTGYAYYYLDLYDSAVPSNSVRNPAYPDVYSFEITGLTGIVGNTQKQYSLSIRQISNTSVNLTLPKDSPVNISVYDISGRSVLSKAMNLPAGQNRVNLDINPGVYFIKVNTPYGNASEKIVNIK